MTYQDNMILSEIHDYDNEMVNVAIKGAKKYHFGQDFQKSVEFMGTATKATMMYLGINVTPDMSENDVERLFDKKEIKIEQRKHYRHNDVWRNGIYVYKKDVLVAFVSQPLAETPSNLSIYQDPSFTVVTNAKVDRYA